MNSILHALGMLCGLGSTALAAAAAPGRGYAAAGLAAGFTAAAVFVGSDGLPDPVWLGILAAATASLGIWRPRFYVWTAAVAGALAGAWISILEVQGMPFAPALLLAAAAPTVGFILAIRRRNFAPQELSEEVLIGVVALGSALAVAPDIIEGWRSARALNLRPDGMVTRSLPAWVLALGAASMALGGIHSLWRRR